jgi:hypothetical protein
MAQSEFADRFLDPTYADDEPVHVFVPGGAEQWVPERIWLRLVSLGKAYQLHLVPLVAGTTNPVYLNGQQVAGLIEEVRFLGAVVNDRLITRFVADLEPLLIEAQRQPGDHALASRVHDCPRSPDQ